MPRIAFVADVHVGNPKKNGGPVVAGINWRCRLSLDALSCAVDHAEKKGADAFVVLGDLFDYTHMEPPIEHAVQQILKLPTVVIVGNHCMASDEPGNNAISPLAVDATVVEKPQVAHVDGVDLVCMPYRPDPVESWLEKEMVELEKDCTDGPRVLCAHFGVSDPKTPYYLDGKSDSIDVRKLHDLCNKYGFDHAFVGHWHEHRVWDDGNVHIRQVGTLAPHRFTDDGTEHVGHMVELNVPTDHDRAEMEIHTVQVPGPRFMYADGLDRLREFEVVARGLDPADIGIVHCFLKGTLKAGEWEEGKKLLAVLPKWVTAMDVVGDVSEAKQAAQDAAQRVRAASTLDGAINGFVDGMPLDDGVDREEVRAAVRRYMR